MGAVLTAFLVIGIAVPGLPLHVRRTSALAPSVIGW
jgi:hypothetical protein